MISYAQAAISKMPCSGTGGAYYNNLRRLTAMLRKGWRREHIKLFE